MTAGPPRLSICIATYNRARFLGESLRSIVDQGIDGVEIVIVDGASPDDTAAVVAPFVDRFPDRIRYVREPIKGGVDVDFAKAVGYARGEYCWLMSDDDPLKPGAIATVLAAVSGGRFSLVVVNAEIRTADLAARLEERRLRVHADQEIADLAELFSLTVSYLTFIGGVVIERTLWLARPHDAYLGSELIHLGVIFQAPLPKPSFILAEPLITLRFGNAQWTGRSFEIWLFKMPRLIWSLSALPEPVRARACPRQPWRSLALVFLYRAKGSYDRAVYRRLIMPERPALLKRWALLAIAWFPGRIANLIAYAGFIIKRPRCSPATLVELANSRYSVLAGRTRK
ncbi:MAG TPA: glycosyltransferase family 2 protein [Planctomycetota bacterium]|nr:glycosyltransferase family 2 protein [Planctomycetota bacterium]